MTRSHATRSLIAFCTIALATSCAAPQQTVTPQSPSSLQTLSSSSGYTILHTFGTDPRIGGQHPQAGLIAYNGSFYGTASSGGRHGKGTIFVVTPSGDSHVLYEFQGGSDGSYPGQDLTELNGTLYGTTELGGGTGCGQRGCGTLYSISLSGKNYTQLYAFTGGSDGAVPSSPMLALHGTFYGTTNGARYSCACGTVYSFSKSAGFKTLYSFAGAPDAALPKGRLAVGSGVIYGASTAGGAQQHGAIYSLTTGGSEHVVYSFAGVKDCSAPQGVTWLRGKLYGTAMNDCGKSRGDGGVFVVTIAGKEQILHSFTGKDGAHPEASLTNYDGTLYGTTLEEGANKAGTVFSMTASGALQTLHNFDFGYRQGGYTTAPVIYSNGLLYGTSPTGGNRNLGLVYSLTP